MNVLADGVRKISLSYLENKREWNGEKLWKRDINNFGTWQSDELGEAVNVRKDDDEEKIGDIPFHPRDPWKARVLEERGAW